MSKRLPASPFLFEIGTNLSEDIGGDDYINEDEKGALRMVDTS